jgi:isopenicillin-N N-acyltransferase like protein
MPRALRPCLAVALSLAAVVVAHPPSAAPCRLFMPAEADGARLFYQDNVPIAILSGTPEQLGRQQAALLAGPAAQALTFPKKFTKAMGAEAFYPLMVLAGRSLMAHAPDAHQQEAGALADGGQLDFGEIAVGNTLLELRRMGCSAVLVESERSATGGPLFGRNLDFPTLGELDKYSLVVVTRGEGRHAFASVTFPAAIGVVSGMNDAGLAIATLDVYESADGSSRFDAAGTPLAFVFRRILEECTTVAEAEALLRSEKPTTWMNLAVCDRERTAVFEITPAHIGRRDAADGLLACTNHFRSDGLVVDNQCWRYDRLTTPAAEPTFDLADVQSRLHAANQGELTLQTMVFEPKSLALHLAIGPPPTSDDQLVRIELAPLFAAEPSAATSSRK